MLNLYRPVHGRASLRVEFTHADRAIAPPTTSMAVWKPHLRDQVTEFFRQVRMQWARLESDTGRFRAFVDNVRRDFERFIPDYKR